MGGKPEIEAFFKLYNVNIHDFDTMTCSTPYLITENDNLSLTIYLTYTKQQSFRFVVDKRRFKEN